MKTNQVISFAVLVALAAVFCFALCRDWVIATRSYKYSVEERLGISRMNMGSMIDLVDSKLPEDGRGKNRIFYNEGLTFCRQAIQ